MKEFWSDDIKNINAYVPGQQPKDKRYIKLNTNENPYPPSPRVVEDMGIVLNSDLRLYPDPDGIDLKRLIGESLNLSQENIFVGNGSDEILAFCFKAFFNKERQILFPDITYSFYKVYADFFKIPFSELEVDNELKIRVEDYKAKNGGIIIANPNAPTGILLELSQIEEILSNNSKSVVIVDEAYIDFGGESAVRLVGKYKNLLVVQTFSKSRSLAGLRVGFAIGNKDLIAALEVVKNCFNSYTLDRLALVGACSSIKDSDYFNENIKKIVKTRAETKEKLSQLGFYITDSKSNFLFIRYPTIKAKTILEQLENRGILVRHFSLDKIENFLRITIGTDDEMNILIRELKKILKGEFV